MPANLNDLVSNFRQRVEVLLQQCGQRGVEMRPYFTLRTPFEQAKLWRQSRSKEEIQKKIAAYRAAGADFLAFC
jgi:peptidoglycan L-alanyl-D-glutamate endopeptidase CwlK